METSVNNECKAFTSLEQSKKLSEILPLESADMHYNNASIKGINYVDEYRAELMDYNTAQKVLSKYLVNPMFGIIPCWSLTTLLSILPMHIIINGSVYKFSMVKGFNKNGESYAIKYAIFNTTFYLHKTDFYNNSIDACYKMIIKLYELNLL